MYHWIFVTLKYWYQYQPQKLTSGGVIDSVWWVLSDRGVQLGWDVMTVKQSLPFMEPSCPLCFDPQWFTVARNWNCSIGVIRFHNIYVFIQLFVHRIWVYPSHSTWCIAWKWSWRVHPDHVLSFHFWSNKQKCDFTAAYQSNHHTEAGRQPQEASQVWRSFVVLLSWFEPYQLIKYTLLLNIRHNNYQRVHTENLMLSVVFCWQQAEDIISTYLSAS